MRITYCIVAHHFPELLRRSIAAMQTPSTRFVVHIDAKSDIVHFEEALRGLPVTFVEPRISVAHGGFTLVEATMNALKSALSLPPADYYPIISGQCHPIRCNAAIEARLDAAKGRNLIGFYPMVAGAKMFYAAHRFSLRDWKNAHPRLRAAIKALELALPPRRMPTDFRIFRGSAYSVLNAETARFLIDQERTDYGRRIARFLRYAFGPDEMYVQTMVLNSPLAESCEGYDHYLRTNEGSERETPWHYVDWSPTRENPALLVKADWNAMRSSHDVFARKFTEHGSDSLLDEIALFRLAEQREYDAGAREEAQILPR